MLVEYLCINLFHRLFHYAVFSLQLFCGSVALSIYLVFCFLVLHCFDFDMIFIEVSFSM